MSGPWTEVLDTELEDCREQAEPQPVQVISLNQEASCRFLKFELVSWWGMYGALQYFGIKQ